jgi:hypothetical protein
MSAARSPVRSANARIETSTLPIIDPISASVSQSSLPVSREISRESSALRLPSTSP